MKLNKLLICAIVGISNAHAAPFVVSDPSADTVITDCGKILDSAAKVYVPVQSVTGGVRCRFDIGGVSVGSHTIKATFRDSQNRKTESPESAAYTFTRPANPVTPSLLLATGTVSPTVYSLVSDAVSLCSFTVDSVVGADKPVSGTAGAKRCEYDLSSVSAGVHSITLSAITVDALWGRLASAQAVPFTYTVTAPLGAPSGLVVEP